MTVTAIESVTTRKSGDIPRVYTSVFRVHTNDKEDGPPLVMINSGLPQLGDTYIWGNSYDHGVWCNGWPDVQLETESPGFYRTWIATSTYSSQGRRESSQRPDNPLSKPWIVQGDSDEWTEETRVSVDGKPLVNSVLRPLTGKAVERFRNRRKIVLSKNYATLNQQWIEWYEGSSNSASVRILGMTFPKETLYMRKIAWSTEYYAESSLYFPHTFHLDVNPDTHRVRVYDMGRHEYTGTDPNDPTHYSEIKDPQTGNPVDEPVFLWNGAVDTLANSGQRPPTILESGSSGFKRYDTYDFNAIGFPT